MSNVVDDLIINYIDNVFNELIEISHECYHDTLNDAKEYFKENINDIVEYQRLSKKLGVI